MPEIGAGYLFAAFCETGMVFDGGPLPWSEIVAFARLEGLDVAEAKVLRQMSSAFLDGYKLGESPLAIAPMDQDEQTEPS